MWTFKQKSIFFLLFISVSILGNVLGFDLPRGIFYTHVILKDNTSLHVLEIDPDFFDIISRKAKLQHLETVETISSRNHALAAINGGFFHTGGELKGIPVGILKIEEFWHGTPRLPRGAIGWSNSNKKVLFDQVLTDMSLDHIISVIPQSVPNYTHSNDWLFATYIVGGTPILVRSGHALTDFSSEKTIHSFLYKKHARTAIGVLKNGHIVLVVVDGSKRFFFGNIGITIPDLANFMSEIGCKEALNLDGGGSSTMILQGNVINTPCGELTDDKGHHVREVSDAILVVPKRFCL